jgi:uncharacterized protein (DUF2062 family)
MWQRTKRFIKVRILHVNDTPHKIALGVAIGVFIGWTPVIGPHMIMALALCALLRANKLAGVASVWVSNPFTMVPIYYPSYLVGRLAVGLWKGDHGLAPSEFMKLLTQMDSISSVLTNFHRMAFWHGLFDILVKIGVELWVGCLIVGAVAAVIAYFLSYGLVVLYRRRHPRRRFTEAQ